MKFPAEQDAIRANCFQSSGPFIEFSIQDVEMSIPARFEKIVKQHPDTISVKTSDHRCPTYAELNHEANRVAHAILAQRGNTAEPIGILFQNSIEQIAVMLGVLKAGKFFVLLDPSFPKARVESVLKDSHAELVITDRHNLLFAHELGCKDDRLMEFESIDSRLSRHNPCPSVASSALAYLVYTSGSTGQPKGVMQSHRNVLHNIMLRTNVTPVYVEDRIASLAAGTAHAVSNTFFALLNGAALFPFDVKKEGIAPLATWLQRERITLLWISSPLFRSFCDVLTGKEDFSNLRLLRLSSETIYKADIDLYKRYFPSNCPLFVGLASSETGLLRSYFVNHETIIAGTEVPVGYAAEGKEISLLDDNGNSVGYNQVGEIVVRSRFLSPGYWRRPDLTDAKFQPDPHDPEKRLYYTGDLGLMLPDGCLIHKGRKDLRVKIHGYGVEISEVEQALRRHEFIKDAVVVAGQDESGESRLMAYYVCSRPPAVTLTQLRSFLTKDLPDYMIPSVFVPLDSMPLLPTGKVDRYALPDPGKERPELDTPYVAPRTGIEQKLRRIWTEVLGLDQIGVHDNFFELGGHSLAATRVVSQVIKTFQLELPLQSLFQSPTVAEMAAIILAESTLEQRIEFESRLSRKSALATITAIPRRDSFSPCPLSFGQERLWFLNQLEPESPVYNESSALRLIGLLDVNALQEAFNCVIARHEVLRTTIALVDGNPMQRIAAHRTIELAAIDLSSHVSKDRDTEARRLVDEAIRSPFDLSNDLMLRTLLLRLDHQEHILLVVKHHVASDGWSSEIFWREVATSYAGFSSGQTANLPELQIQYADYAAWQRNWLAGEVSERQLSYWRKQLQDIPAAINLPTDRSRPAVQSYRGARESIELSKELTQKLKALGRSHGVTLYMTLLAAFQTLLFRYTGQDDIAVGSPIAGRTRDETEGLIGFFVNTLVLRTDLTTNPTFRELMERVSGVCLNAYSHQDLPFEKIVEELHPDRHLNQNPLFQIAFQLNTNTRKPLNLPGLRVENIELEHPMSKFDLSLSMTDRSESISGRIIYNADLFDAATIERMVGHFQVLLEGIVANPEQPISGLPLLTEAETHQLLVEWNDTKTDYFNDQCIHQLFETQAEKTPDAIALVCEDQNLTYRELNSRANQVAHYLQVLGVGPEAPVGICLERSIEMIVGLLAILKAGGAYVPLDPAYPKERLKFILDDSQARIVLTRQPFLDVKQWPMAGAEWCSLVSDTRIERVCLDRDWCDIEKESGENLENEATADRLAYVIYTSGSTGRPKGVGIEHRNAVSFLTWAHSVFTRDEFLGVLASTSICFDLSVFEIFAPLTCGGTVILAENALALRTIANASAVTLLNTVPSAITELLSLGALPTSVRVINLAGEPLRTEVVRRICASTPAAKIYDLYGPSECTTYSTWMRRTPEGRQSIGRPIANTQIYILGGHMQPVPIGVVGEICIGGSGVARGYLNQPKLTQEKFIADPFSIDPGARLYKTGDLARYLPDGNIEFLGRIDNQVKIRGFRIELGEIESVLGQHSGVRQSAVIVREDTVDERLLVAYVVAIDDPAPSINDLRSFLKANLPEYMIPSAFVFLESLPLTTNGKVDRKALPVPDQTRPELDAIFMSPRTPMEEMLAEIWAEVLKVEGIGIHDNFFDLGGHSLLATQVVSRMRRAVQVEIPLRALFESPTVVGLAARIEEIHQKQHGLQAPPLLAVSRDKDLPLSFAQHRLWFLDQLEPGSTVYNVPIAVRIRGPLDVAALERSINEIIARHEILRTTFSTVEGEAVQIIAPSSSHSLPVVDLSGQAESARAEQARRLAREEAWRPFDLARGPLVRVTLLRLGQEDHVLLLTLHHIVSDGWSMKVLFRELSALYNAFSQNHPSPLSQLPIQYADFGAWQRQWLQGEILETQLSYWKKQLKDVVPLQLPTDRPRPALPSYRGARESIELSKELTQELKALSRSHDVTLYMTLLAAFQTLLFRYTAQDDIAVGAPIAGRTHDETEGLIGFFVNTLVLRSDLSGNPPFRELLGRVREVALGAYAHQDLPFEKLVEELQPERNLGHSPLFQVMFVLQNTVASAPVREFAGIKLRLFGVESEPAKFDVMLTMREGAGGLKGSLLYNTDLFDEVTIKRMVGHFQTLLEGIVAHPEQRISELSVLTDSERHQLLVEWNDTKGEYPRDKCIHRLFEDQVERSPDAIALANADQQLTYGALNRRANQLAHYLRKQGVGPEVLVGICMERSLDLIVGLLGILKAGGAYVPLEPDYPKERLAFMREDAEVSLLLTQEKFLFEMSRQPVVCLDRDREKIAQQSDRNPVSQVRADNLAYVIYTSGSTGRPKGVQIEHQSLVNCLWSIGKQVGLNKKDVLLAVTTVSFDIAALELYLPLIVGATVVLAGRDDALDGRRIVDRLKSSGATVMQSTPSSWKLLVDAGWEGHDDFKILCGGEALSERLADQLLERAASLWNLYGPTETTVWSTTARVKASKRPVPIGRPIANTRLFILDSHLHPVPIGVPGELCVGGDGVARGYRNRPDLTAERFILNPFSDPPEARLYRTGDLARYLPDGNIEFYCRIDNQVKIRGYRIELGEVESVLAQHPAIQQAVVIAREDTPGGRRLVAYCVATADSNPLPHDLRSYLKHKLPDYMIPSTFVLLDSLPLAPNGKLDRKALMAPDGGRPELDDGFAAPRTPLEETLANIWAKALRLDKVGIHDNFFDLGGHSLLATQVMSRMQNAFSVELPLRQMFESPTVAELAIIITETQHKRGSDTQQAQILRELDSMTEEDAQGHMDEIDSTITKE